MRFIRFILGISILIMGCSSEPKNDLPDLKLITELINETIKQDSLRTAVPVNIQIVDYFIQQDLKSDSIILPAPPVFTNNIGEGPLDYGRFKIELEFFLNYYLSKEDSLSIIRQVALNKKLKLDSSKIDKSFIKKDFDVLNFRDVWKDEIYFFRLPIFNKEKDIAMIAYDYMCSGCSYGREVFFKKVNNKWFLVESYDTWRN